MIESLNSDDINRIADWIELYVLFKDETISKSKILSILEDSPASADEEKVDSAIQELNRRLSLYGEVKPYEINGNSINPLFNWEEYPEFTLFLYFSTFGAGNEHIGTKLFERITKHCLEKQLECNSVLFGFPAEISFKNQLDDFADLIRENRFEHPLPSDKDRGVDIIAWIEFDNFRTNSILLFVQCAAGLHWNDKKPVAIESYRRYLSFGYKTTISSLSVTQIIDIDDWRNATDDYGILFDRARLYRIITSNKYNIDLDFKKEIRDWCNQKLN